MTSETYPRVTYTNIGVDFSSLQAMLDRALPAYKAKLGAHVPNVIDGVPDEVLAALPVKHGNGRDNAWWDEPAVTSHL